MATIDAGRMLKDLYEVREIGKYKTGVHRPTYSADDVKARHWLVQRLTDAGLEASIDGIGNVYGRDPRPGRKLLTGSHIETQNHAGWLDGILGVIYGLEAARALNYGVDVVAFADEEGHFAPFVGSRSFCGLLTEPEIDACANRETGQSLRDALRQAGFSGRPRQTVDAARYRG
jgi:beta-ureidopropionase / N-carbamoyl-L-amino-acid hydrolase